MVSYKWGGGGGGWARGARLLRAPLLTAHHCQLTAASAVSRFPPRRYGTNGLGISFAAHNPELKSVNNTRPFQGIAFITNGALGV